MKVFNRFPSTSSFLTTCFCLAAAHSSLFAERGTFAQLSSLQTQLPGTGPQVIAMRSVDALSNIDRDSDNKLIIKEGGAYMIIAAGQVGQANSDKNASSTGGYVDLWLRKNDQPIPNTNTRQSVDMLQSTAVLVSQAIVNLSPRDIISVGYAASKPSLGLIATQGTTDEPAIPSIIFSIYKL